MNKATMANLMHETFERLDKLRAAGQAEYAGAEDYAFGNFDRLATSLKLDRKAVLWVYLAKHLDGITSFINGHKSQREDVEGRIDDAIVYLELLRGMIRMERRGEEREYQENLAMTNAGLGAAGESRQSPFPINNT